MTRRAKQTPARPRIAMSRCLLGQRVRYDGGHKYAPLLVAALREHFEILPVCPEVEAGLSVPRTPAQVRGTPLNPRFVDIATNRDRTPQVLSRTVAILGQWAARGGVHGFVGKNNSPSCANIRPAPLWNPLGRAIGRSMGVFAHALAERFPGLPMGDELHLAHGGNLDQFIRAVQRFAARKAQSRR